MTCESCGNDLPAQQRGRPRRWCSDECRLYAGARGAWPSRVCSHGRCQRAVHREGLCSKHLRASQPRWTMRDELTDWLALEGWATAEEAAERFGRHVDSVQRTLRELRREGVVESKTVELAGFHVRDRRTEWRLAL